MMFIVFRLFCNCPNVRHTVASMKRCSWFSDLSNKQPKQKFTPQLFHNFTGNCNWFFLCYFHTFTSSFLCIPVHFWPNSKYVFNFLELKHLQQWTTPTCSLLWRFNGFRIQSQKLGKVLMWKIFLHCRNMTHQILQVSGKCRSENLFAMF